MAPGHQDQPQVREQGPQLEQPLLDPLPLGQVDQGYGDRPIPDDAHEGRPGRRARQGVVLREEPLDPAFQDPISAEQRVERHATFEKDIPDATNDVTRGVPPHDIGISSQARTRAAFCGTCP